jgi:hypothetical protein
VHLWFRFDRWLPKAYSISVLIAPDTPVPFSIDLAGIIAFGNASGKLDLSMENDIITLQGDLTAHDTEITLNTDELESGASASSGGKQVLTDINITAGRRVEFLWPNADLPILRAYGDAGTGIRIVGDSLADRFAISGDVTLRGGEIFYFQRNFYIREGQIFFSGNEIQFDPRISARAEIRDQNDEGPITISLIIDNSPLRSFVPRFESNPPLSQLEIYSFLGQNSSGAATAEAPIGDFFFTTVTDVLAQFGVVRRAERQIGNILGLDMFSVRTQALQNAVFQAVGAQYTVDESNRMGNYFDNTTVFMGKYIGSDMFIQTMFSLRYDENQVDYGGLGLEPDIGLEFRTPLFDVQWNIIPEDMENMFVNNQSLTLTRRWTF